MYRIRRHISQISPGLFLAESFLCSIVIGLILMTIVGLFVAA